jgi:hypothetical protein
MAEETVPLSTPTEEDYEAALDGWHETSVPLGINVRVSTEAIKRMAPEVYIRMIERAARSFFAEAKALYREVHPEVVFRDEREKGPTVHLTGDAVRTLLEAAEDG